MFYTRSSAAHLEGLTAAIRRALCNPKKGCAEGGSERTELRARIFHAPLMLKLHGSLFIYTRATARLSAAFVCQPSRAPVIKNVKAAAAAVGSSTLFSLRIWHKRLAAFYEDRFN